MAEKKIRNQKTIQELKRIAERNKGLLEAEAVVKAAEPSASPLHSYFDWNNTEAGRLWRLHQARQLIRVCVEVIDVNGHQEQRVFVNLREDRPKGGGYRTLVKVLSTPSLREELLEDALEEMNYFREKYKSLKELSVVFKAMTAAERRLLAKSRRAA